MPWATRLGSDGALLAHGVRMPVVRDAPVLVNAGYAWLLTVLVAVLAAMD